MKNLSLVLLVLVMLCGVANASIIDCGTGVFAYPTWSTSFVGAGNGCALGDKVFTNFSVGTIPTDTAIQFGVAGTFFTVNFIATPAGGFKANFIESFHIAIDPTKPPASLNDTWISAVAAGMQDSGGDGNAMITKVLNNGSVSGVASATDVHGTITPVILSGIHQTSMDVTDTFAFFSGNITNVSNTFNQTSATGVPEPASMALLGGGLLALCFGRRRRA